MLHDNETLVIDSADSIKSIEVKDGKARVGAYAIRFSGPEQKDLQGEYFTPATYFGARKGDGADVLFSHGRAQTKAFTEICDRVFAAAKTTLDDVGVFVEHCLDLADDYEKAIADLCAQGKLKWSSGATSHMVKVADGGEIKRWPIAEFSYTPTPAEPRLPAIAPLKSVTMDEATAKEISKSFVVVADPPPPKPAPVPPPPSVDIQVVRMTEVEQAAKDAATEKNADERVEARTKEISEMYAVGAQINDIEIARKFVSDGKSIDALRQHVLENVLKARPVATDSANIGMSTKEVKKYSLLRAMHSMATKGRLEGVEKEAHDAAVKAYGREDLKGFLVPEDVSRGFSRSFTKAQNVTTATAGGFLVETDFGPMIELLRNRPVVVQAGATTLGGLVGDLALPRHVSGATAYWVSETGSLTDSQSVFGQKKLTPRRLGATIPYSTQFLAQSSIDAESFIRDDATRVLAIEKDRASLAGAGVGGEPLGLALDPDINATVTYGGAAEWGDIIEHETGIAVDNADIGSMGFVINAATRGKWKTALKVATYGGTGYLMDGNTANGYPVYVTNQTFAVASQSFFGVWSQLILASWAGMEVIVDPYALKKSGQVEITFNELCDICVRQPLAFNVSTDSAAA